MLLTGPSQKSPTSKGLSHQGHLFIVTRTIGGCFHFLASLHRRK